MKLLFVLCVYCAVMAVIMMMSGCKINSERMDMLDKLIASGQVKTIQVSDSPQGFLKIEMQGVKAR